MIKSLVTFGDDDRDRLISESRSGDNAYSLSYTYDQLGNRLSKTDDSDPQNVVATIYQYDITDPDPAFPTTNNRLMQYGLDTDGDGTADVRNVSYTYYKTGQVSNITIKDVGDILYRDLALYYARNGTLWLAVWGNYKVNQNNDPIEYTVTAAREFRYDNPRQRYMSRDYVIGGSNIPENWMPMAIAQWTDYNGAMPYLDFDLGSDQNGVRTYAEQTSYLAGRGVAAHPDGHRQENPERQIAIQEGQSFGIEHYPSWKLRSPAGTRGGGVGRVNKLNEGLADHDRRRQKQEPSKDALHLFLVNSDGFARADLSADKDRHREAEQTDAARGVAVTESLRKCRRNFPVEM